MCKNYHENILIHSDFALPWINERKKTFCYSLESWRDERLCKQPLNCLTTSFVEQKLRGGKIV